MTMHKRKFSKPMRNAANDAAIKALIEKGGSSPSSVTKENAKDEVDARRVQLRIPAQLIADIDKSVQSRPIRIPRHTWILEAIYDKLAAGQPDSE